MRTADFLSVMEAWLNPRLNTSREEGAKVYINQEVKFSLGARMTIAALCEQSMAK